MSLLLFFSGTQSSGVPSTSNNFTLFTWGHLPFSGVSNLYINGGTTQDHFIPMLIGGNDSGALNCTLFLNGNDVFNSGITLAMSTIGILNNYDNGPPMTLTIAGSNGSGSTAGITLFTQGSLSQDSSPSGVPLYILPNTFIDTSGPTHNPWLFILPTQSASGTQNLFIHGRDTASGNVTLVMKVNTPASGGIPLAMNVSPSPANANINLVIIAPTPTPQDGNVTLSLTGSTNPALVRSIPLFTAVGASGSSWNDHMNLFLLADLVSPRSSMMNLYIPGYGNIINNNITLFVQNTLSPSDSGISLFMRGPDGLVGGSMASGTMNLFIGKGSTNFTTLFLQTSSPSSGVTYLYLNAIPNISGGFTLTMPNTVGIGSGTPTIYMVGF